VDKLTTLLTLQELPEVRDGGWASEFPRLLAPAVYAIDNVAQEKDRLEGLAGSFSDESLQKLEKSRWIYDLVLELHDLDDIIVAQDSGKLEAHVEPVKGPDNSQHIGIWAPDDESGHMKVLDRCVSIPWLPPRTRLRLQERCVVYPLVGKVAHNTLVSVSELWARENVRNVLLAGEPGSGKEVVSRLIHSGRARGRFVPASFAGDVWDSWRIPLLGEGEPGGRTILTGILEQAIENGVGGTVLFDEIDKAKPDVRSALLRIIEADEYLRPGNGERVRFEAPRRPLYIFAGSGNGDVALGKSRFYDQRWTNFFGCAAATPMCIRDRMKMEPPSDFWNRMDWPLTVENPLAGVGNNDMRDYVCLFMRRARAKHDNENASVYATDRLLKMDYEAANEQLKTWWETAVTELLANLRRWSFRVLRDASEEFVRSVLSSRSSRLDVSGLLTPSSYSG